MWTFEYPFSSKPPFGKPPCVATGLMNDRSTSQPAPSSQFPDAQVDGRPEPSRAHKLSPTTTIPSSPAFRTAERGVHLGQPTPEPSVVSSHPLLPNTLRRVPHIPRPKQRESNASFDPSRQEAVVISGGTVDLLGEVVNLRTRDVTKRIHLKNGIRDTEFQWQYAKQAQDAFLAESARFMSLLREGAIGTQPDQALNEAWKKLENLSDHVETRESRLRRDFDYLFQMEDKLHTKETKLYDRLRGVSSQESSTEEEEEDDDDVYDAEGAREFMRVTAPSSSSSDSSTPPIAQEYYNQVGDMHLLREQFFNFDSEHRRQKLNREALRKAGHNVEPSDALFTQRFLAGRENMTRQYVFAWEKMERLRDSCASQDIHVQPPNLPPFLDHSYRAERRNRNISDPFQGGFLPDVSVHSDDSGNRHRIVRWMREIRKVDHAECMESSMASLKPPSPSIVDSHQDPIDDFDILEFTDQEAYEYLPLPPYNHLESRTVVDDRPTNEERIRRRQTGGSAIFQGEAPRRRYSAPSWGTWLGASQDDIEGMSKSWVIERKQESADEPLLGILT